ncbi:FAD-dependent thymidylate synthase, partial [Candidatus Bathyarchaeota archaeon]|nr:FAD-dependent thymidylate synthase [Candidatus Bathyarchaeota archaeon]
MTSKIILFSYTNYPSLISSLQGQGVKISREDLLRHGSFTFDLEGVSRAASHQIVRHRIASFSQQSQRYVKITRSYGYLKPSGIPEDLKVPVEIHGQKMDLNFADVMDLTRQAEEGLVAKGIKAEDSRYLRPNAATTNIVMSMGPRQLIHFFNLRCAPDAQWEIRDLAWSMYSTVRLAAPGIFGPLPAAEESDYVKKRVLLVEELVEKQRVSFEATAPGELFHLETSPILDLSHRVDSYVRK